MDFIYNTLTLYKSALLKRVPFQLSLHFTGAIITFGNKMSGLVLDFFKFIDFSFVVGVGAGSILDISKYRDTCERSIFDGIAILRYIEYRTIR